jgi:acyl-[acyl-carrier-protein] desaturase
LAEKAGDTMLSKMCRTIAGDEARHEKAYQAFMTKIFAADPNGAMLAFEDMMRRQIVMPAVNMNSKGNNLFERYAAITQKMGIYTTFDYADIIAYLVDRWQIESILGLNAAAAKAQDYLSTLAAKYRRLADRLQVPGDVELAWVNGM